MRIIAGAYKGRNLKSPPSMNVRPTSDRLRETLFNVIAPRIEDARFLDLCAGSGAVGIEALSRGASHATFVERSTKICSFIESNLERCGISKSQAEACLSFYEKQKSGVRGKAEYTSQNSEWERAATGSFFYSDS